MINSFEEIEGGGDDEDAGILLYCDEIISTSLKEKSIVFADIEKQLVEPIVENRYLSVINELKLNFLQRKYTKKIYNIVLHQLIKDKQIRQNSKLWNNFITSF